jgi:hypothetical protein
VTSMSAALLIAITWLTHTSDFLYPLVFC